MPKNSVRNPPSWRAPPHFLLPIDVYFLNSGQAVVIAFTWQCTEATRLGAITPLLAAPTISVSTRNGLSAPRQKKCLRVQSLFVARISCVPRVPSRMGPQTESERASNLESYAAFGSAAHCHSCPTPIARFSSLEARSVHSIDGKPTKTNPTTMLQLEYAKKLSRK